MSPGFNLDMNEKGLLLSLYEFLQLRNIDPFVIEKYLRVVGNEVN